MVKKIKPRILVAPDSSFFLFGPRGTGKTTWLKHVYPDAYRIDLLDESLYQSYLAQVGLFAQELNRLSPGSLVVVDEIQRIPALLNEVHRFMEDRELRFVLCGSSARKLKKAGTNLLAGRALRRMMHPFVPQELGAEFQLEDILRWGSLPVVLASSDRKGALQAYVQMYLKEEIQAEALVRNLPAFARFLPVAALFHGQVLNAASLARDAGVSRTTVLGYLEILEDTLVAFQLPALQARLRVRERKMPKLYWVDAGLPRTLKRQFATPSPEERGALFEGWVASLLRAYRDYRDLFDEFFYWSAAGPSGVEVDFILIRGNEKVAIEVKSGGAISNKHLGGLRAVGQLPGMGRRILLHTGIRDRRTDDDIDILTLPTFLELLESGTLFDG